MKTIKKNIKINKKRKKKKLRDNLMHSFWFYLSKIREAFK